METLQQFLAEYDVSKYKSPSVTVDIAVFTVMDDLLHVLLIKRKNHPYINLWALPGGFIEMQETLIESARRELMEETSQDAQLFQIGCFGEPTRDPRNRIITAAFAAVVPQERLRIKAGDDASEAGLYRVDLSFGEIITVPPRRESELIHLPCTADGTQFATGKRCTLTLTGEHTLTSELAVNANKAALLSSDLSSDHALIIFHALQFLDKEKLIDMHIYGEHV